MQPEAIGNVGAMQPALGENANTTLTTASTKNDNSIVKVDWPAPVSCARPAVCFGKVAKNKSWFYKLCLFAIS